MVGDILGWLLRKVILNMCGGQALLGAVHWSIHQVTGFSDNGISSSNTRYKAIINI